MKEKVSELLTLFKTERGSFREIESQFPPNFGDYRKVNYFRERKVLFIQFWRVSSFRESFTFFDEIYSSY